MATGRLGNTQLSTGNTTVYTVPTGYYTVLNVSFTNTSATAVTIKVGMASTTSPTTSEWIEQQTTIVGYGVFERTGLVMQAGLNIVALASTGSVVNVTAYGIETSTS
jgi:hypothetical protein